ncbi:Patatin-like phospholipase domain-containing protein [Diplonema papillatum]|nr:Patatin-like phospholipase domain-containing protein [Diplonema papillatum]
MLKNLRVMSHFRLFIDSLGVDWSAIYNQDFGSDLTLAPPLTVADYCSLIWNLTDDKHGLDLLRHRVHVGETICWKALPMFKNRMDIQVALNKALTRLRFQPSKTTLH